MATGLETNPELSNLIGAIMAYGPQTIDHSIVVARNLGIQKKHRKPSHIQVEDFLIDLCNLHGLNLSDVANVAIEKHLKDRNLLDERYLSLLSSVSTSEKQIFEHGIEHKTTP